MTELADVQDLGSCGAIRVGSTPTTRTTSEQAMYRLLRLFLKVRARSRRCSSFPNRNRLRWVAIWGRRFAADLSCYGGNIDFNRPFQKERHDQRSCLSFWVPAAKGGFHPLVKMLGGNGFRLRRGFACGKTLVRRKSAAGRMAGRAILPQRSRRSKIDIFW